jgi:hypothetical protein
MTDEMGNFIPTQQQVLGGTVQSTIENLPSPTDIYSAQNIEQTVNSPVPKPNLDDPLGMYDYYMASPEITQAQSQYQSAFGQLTEAQQTARARQLAIEQNPLEAMSNIVGQQSRAGQLDSITQQALAENVGVAQSALASLKSTATDKFNIAQQQRSEMTNLIANNPGAGIKYTDDYETGIKKAETYQTQQRVESIALQYPGAKISKTDDMATVTKKIDDYNKNQEKKAKKEAEEAKKDAYKDALKAQLQALGSSTKGLSKNELEKKLKKKNKEALAEAKKVADLEYQIKLKSLNSKDEVDTIDWNTANVKQGTTELIQEAKDKGLYGGYLWEYVETEAKKVGIPTYQGSDFDKQIKELFEQ